MANKLCMEEIDGLLVWGDDRGSEPMLILDRAPQHKFRVSLWSIDGKETEVENFSTLREALRRFADRMED